MAAAADVRRRGPDKAAAWRYDGPVSVLRLPLDVHDSQARRHVERVFSAAFAVRRAVQRDAQARLAAYRAAHRERAAAGPAAVRDRLGLTLSGLERAAYRHLDGAPHLRRHATKALVMHGAAGVWQAVHRHLFPDTSGRRFGPPRVGDWWSFRTIPGRARSHTGRGSGRRSASSAPSTGIGRRSTGVAGCGSRGGCPP